MPDPNKLAPLIRQAALAFRGTAGRKGHFTRLPPSAHVLVVGDLHGHVDNFRKALKLADLAGNPHRHLVVQELVHGSFHYPDGGDKSHQLVDLICALKVQYPHRVHYLMGNHELAQWRKHRIGKGDVDQNVLFEQGVRTAYGDKAPEILMAYQQLFAELDLILVTANRICLSHTFPQEKYLDAFTIEAIERGNFQDADLKMGGCLHSLVWSRDLKPSTVDAYLKKVDADFVITGHIPNDQGYVLHSERHLALDAKGSPAGYCLLPTQGLDVLGGVGLL